MIRFPKRLLTLCLLCFGLTGFHTPALGVELTFPGVEIEPGGGFEIPVLVDAVENLAGLKLSLAYDDRVLNFKKAEKTRATTSLMHIVNDKKPGVLIIVMAGARGIQGKELPLLRLSFEAETPENLPHETKIEVKEIQMMSDQLKDLPTTTVIHPILIRTPGKILETEQSADIAPENSIQASDSVDLAPEFEKNTKISKTEDSTSNSEKIPSASESTDSAPESEKITEKAE